MMSLEQQLQPTEKTHRTVFVIYGMGGMGKTQLAVQYARKHSVHYSAIIWVNGNSRGELHQSLLSFVSRIPSEQLPNDVVRVLHTNSQELSDEESISDIKDQMIQEAMRTWLSQKGNVNWLMIMDNVDTEKDYPDSAELAFSRILDAFPYGDNGSIIITTRLVQLKTMFARGMKLAKMSDADAKAMLQQKLNVEGKKAI